MRRIDRREFLKSVSAGFIGGTVSVVSGCSGGFDFAGSGSKGGGIFKAGQGCVNIDPAVGMEIAGFHRKPGNERLVTGARHPAFAKALVVEYGGFQAAIVSVALCGVSRDFAARVSRRAAERTGIPAENIRICATHTHSMPMLRYLRQWGATMPPHPYIDSVEERIIEAVECARNDKAYSRLYVGQSRAEGGNSNRTTKVWKTDAEFTNDSTDDDRWLDTLVQVLYFEREGPKKDLLWYHFSAHPVCFRDGATGPDWPAIVSSMVKSEISLSPVYLQGHAGDVNPGDGRKWIGDAKQTAEAVYQAIMRSIESKKAVKVNELRVVSGEVQLPLDIERLKEDLSYYEAETAHCNKGPWVDAGFAKDWYEDMSKWDFRKVILKAPVSAMKIGQIGFVFHPSELYSYYGLKIRHESPFKHTLVVGYTDGLVGYLTDPRAYEQRNYEAFTVPKILNLPPFKPYAARRLSDKACTLLKKTG